MSVAVIKPQALAELSKEGRKIDLIDVRTPVEYREVHVDSARNVPLDQLDPAAMMQARNGSANEPLYLICRSGSRGQQACEKFLKAGFSNVVNVEGGTMACVEAGLLLRYGMHSEDRVYQFPLWIVLAFGGIPLVYGLLKKVAKFEFGSDLLAGISIVTAVLLGEYLAGALVVLMLSGGEALETYAVRSASSVLHALAQRMPSLAHRRQNGQMVDVPLSQVAIGDTLVIFPHDICPVDGVVTEGRGIMDESFLTGEPFQMSKTPGSDVISGAINGETALTIRATRPAADSRYAKIMEVMRSAEQNRPRMRRLGDTLGAFYTPLAVLIAVLAWGISGQSSRFLAVLVVATPCPLLIAIPVAIIGAISLCARRGIIVKNPVVLETIATCRTAIFDKTGTLTYRKLHSMFAPHINSPLFR